MLRHKIKPIRDIMKSSNGNIFRVTGPLWWEFTGYRQISLSKTNDADLWSFLWSAPWINGWVNNREAGDLGCHRARNDAIVTEALRWPRQSNDPTEYVWYNFCTVKLFHWIMAVGSLYQYEVHKYERNTIKHIYNYKHSLEITCFVLHAS